MMPPKLFSSEVLQRVTRLCQDQGVIYPVSPRADSPSRLPCYNYGPVGALLRNNFAKEWWAEILNRGDMYQVVSSTSSPWTRKETGLSNNYWLEKDHYQSVLSMVRRCLPFGVASQVPAYSQGEGYHEDPVLTTAGREYRAVHGSTEHSTYNPGGTSTIHGSTEHSSGTSTVAPGPENSDRFIYRCRNQEELVSHYYSPPRLSAQIMDRWRQQRLRWWKKFACTPSLYRAVDGHSTEGSQHVSIQFPFPWGLDTVEVIQNLGSDYLMEQQELTGISHQGLWNTRPCMPDVVQSRCVLEHGLLACLLDAFSEHPNSDSGESETMMRFHTALAPYKVAVLTSTPTTSGEKISDHLTNELRKLRIPVYSVNDPNSTIQQQLARLDQLGVPWCVECGEEAAMKGAAKLRNRDTMLWEEVNILKLPEKILMYLKSSKSTT